jgi:hypothetical protein
MLKCKHASVVYCLDVPDVSMIGSQSKDPQGSLTLTRLHLRRACIAFVLSCSYISLGD